MINFNRELMYIGWECSKKPISKIGKQQNLNFPRNNFEVELC